MVANPSSLGVADGVFFICLLQNVEGFFLLAVGRDEAFAIEVVLYFGQEPER